MKGVDIAWRDVDVGVVFIVGPEERIAVRSMRWALPLVVPEARHLVDGREAHVERRVTWGELEQRVGKVVAPLQ